MRIDSLDHLVLTVKDVAATIAWYEKVLGMKAVAFGEGRKALQFGTQKINLHPAVAPIVPHAQRPTPGSADLCFLTTVPLKSVIAHLDDCQVLIQEGPVSRTGATGDLRSLYIRDPDGNLIEIANLQTLPFDFSVDSLPDVL
jgi:catechol 2,3-dioxygenase-like lactoylglutathione lyase family enzyme